jgi:hypothetical protein
MANTYVKIGSTVTVGSGGAANIVFSSIPNTFTDLCLKISARTNRANAVDSLGFYFNGDTTAARYTSKVLFGDGTSAGSNSPSPANDEVMFVSGNNATASTFGNSELYLPNYAGSTQKSGSLDSVGETNGTTIRMNIAGVLYNQTTAISSITIIPITGTLLQQYSTATLYGILKS